MNYRHYQLEDFLCDEDFKEWVLDPNSRSNNFWGKVLRSSPDIESRIIQAKEIILNMEFKEEVPTESDFNEVLSNISDAIQSNDYEVESQPELHSRFYWLKIAAIILIVLLPTIFLYKSLNQSTEQDEQITIEYINKFNPAGQKSKIYLPDGTSVWLNSESSVSYVDGFEIDQRRVELIGEAYFDIVKDAKKPFVVKANNVSVMALGTSFNVRDYQDEDQVNISLTTGEVLVTTNNDLSKVYLHPGEQVILGRTDGRIVESKFDPRTTIGWKDGLIYFENASYAEITKKLQRWYGVKFKLLSDTSPDWGYTGSFRESSLEMVMERLSYVESFGYEIHNNVVWIK